MKKTCITLCFLILCASGCASTAVAQSTQGTITGVVTDGSGSVIPGVEVTITNTNTGVITRTRTNDEGVYNVTSINPAPYVIEARVQGFKTQSQQATLQAAQTLRLDATLELGDVAETVEVSADAALLTRESPEVSTSISAAELPNLPLADRSPYGTLILVPGASPSSDDPSSPGGNVASINGTRVQNSQISLDGINLNSVGGIGERVGSIESLQEVKVLTSTYSAEFAQTSGGAILFQVKSGTRNYHGTLYGFHINSALNANNWQNNARNVQAAKTQRTEAGGTFGGPVPFLRKKFFFFASYEGTGSRLPTNRTRTIPTAALRTGDFSGVPVLIQERRF